ncbi:MAG: lysophospholipase [Bacilli bacterium]|nr:lysophospholipase [Bacilli bacterium]
MKKIDYELPVSEGYVLKGHIWEADAPKAIVMLCHGMAEHIARYDDFACFLAKNNYTVVGYDQRGHGETAGSVENLGYMSDDDNFVALVEDLHETNKMIKEKYPDMKVFLFGHSMGSFVSQRYIQLYSDTIDGVILSGSALNKGLLFKVGYKLAKSICKKHGRKYQSELMNNMSFGSYNKKFKPNRTEYDWLSRNEENVDKYIADPYCGTLFTVSFFMDMIHLFLVMQNDFDKVRKDLPIYIMSGDKDPVGSMGKATKALAEEYKKNEIGDVELKLYPDGRHEMLNEINKDEVYANVLEWINKH